jgi:glycosyltransferase involved in cell wall biosynthesis
MISNSKNIDISILVPCYNSSSTIERCLDSIIDQEYNLKKIKIICINDGSTDNTLQILQKYKKKYDSIFEIYSQENEGLAKTRQNLLSHVTTTFFMFLDSDDFFLPKAFKRIVNASKNGKFIVTVSKSTRYFENKKKHRIW